MSVLFQSPDLQLPWSSSRQENNRFNIIAIIILVITLVFGFLIQSQDRPDLSQKEKEKIPASLAKIMERKKKEKPKPKPVVKEKKAEEKKPEEKKPKKKKKEPPKPKTEEQKKAREKAKKELAKNQAALDALKSLQMDVKPQANLTKAGSKAKTVDRKVITGGPATATSGGIQTAAIPSSTSVGKGLQGRSVLQVSDGTLGGTQVDTSGGVDAATSSASQGVAGQRSEEQIRRVLDGAKGALYSIYNRELRKDPTLQGKVTFEITIDPDGSVSNCKIVSSELANPKLERRLVSKMKQLNFGAADVAVTKTRWAVDFLPF